jgi:[protein-PII] uridylyltransferase
VLTLERSPDGVEADGDTVTVLTTDRPGVFSRIAGALALHGVEVLDAVALSDDGGRAASRFTVVDPMRGAPPWAQIVPDIERALDGRLALDARLAERRARYERRPVAGSGASGRDAVHFDDDASATATVIDVHTTDATGVLYRVTRALADLDLDIRSAKVQTVGREVVDAFYVRDRRGEKVVDEALRAEIVRAVTHALTS